jgi:hypothetical protein
MKCLAITLQIRIKEQTSFKPFEMTYMPYESTQLNFPKKKKSAQIIPLPTCKLLGG